MALNALLMASLTTVHKLRSVSSKLTRFEYVEPNGNDVGLNVRKKAETVLAIIDDREKLQQIREKAAATRNKYFGLSSTGITYKSCAASFGSGNFSSGSYYGSTGSSFRDSNRGKEWGNRSKGTVSGYSSSEQMSKEGSSGSTSYRSAMREGHENSNQGSSTLSATYRGLRQQNVDIEDDDDFNPRGSSSSSAGTENVSSGRVDLFRPSLIGDLVDITSTSTVTPHTGPAAVPEVDLFAALAFQSVHAPLETANGSHAQDNIDLFAGRSLFAGSIVSDTESSVRGDPSKYSEHNLSFPAHHSGCAVDPSRPSFAIQFPSDTGFSLHYTPSESRQEKNLTPEHSSAPVFDPFAAIPLKSFDGSDSSGAFSPNTGSVPAEPRHGSPGGIKSSESSPLEELNCCAFTSQTESPTASTMKSMNKSPTNMEHTSTSATFQVKSGVWADSLSRGLINLDIATSLGMSGFPSSTGTSFQRQQYGGFNY